MRWKSRSFLIFGFAGAAKGDSIDNTNESRPKTSVVFRKNGWRSMDWNTPIDSEKVQSILHSYKPYGQTANNVEKNQSSQTSNTSMGTDIPENVIPKNLINHAANLIKRKKKHIKPTTTYQRNDIPNSYINKIASSEQRPKRPSKKKYKIYISKKNMKSKLVSDNKDSNSLQNSTLPSNEMNNMPGQNIESSTETIASAIGVATAAASSSSSTKHLITRLLNLSLTGMNIAMWYFIGRMLWKATKEVLDEIAESEASSVGYGFNSPNSMKEDHDLPFVRQDEVDSITRSMLKDLESEGKDTDNTDEREDVAIVSNSSDKLDSSLQNKTEKNETNKVGYKLGVSSSYEGNNTKSQASDNQNRQKPSTLMSNLALRLAASGLPIMSSSSRRSVDAILKSLTKTEGQLLNNVLLSPLDTQENGIILGSPDREERLTRMWEEIGGLEDVKEALLDLVFPMLISQQQQQKHDNEDGEEDDQNHDEMYYGGLLSNPPGVLLYGPPGCGKTMLVRALAHTANARFLCVTPSTLLRKYVGETNLNIRALFSMARKISPCIIFIDEMEGLFKERSSGGGTGDELLTELKTEFMQLWDGIHSRGLEDEQILVIGATNRPFDVDSAFLRRMPRSFFVGLPSLNSRIAILKSQVKNVPLSKSFDVESLAMATENYSPSDLKEVLRTAALKPLREARRLAIQRQSVGKTGRTLPNLRPLTTSDVMDAREKVAPTQFSARYRVALADYAHRASGGRANLNGLSSDSGDKAYQHHSLTNTESANSQIFFTNFHSEEMPDYNIDKHDQDSFEDYDATDDYDDSSSYEY